MPKRIPEDDPLPGWFRRSLLYRLLFVRLWSLRRLCAWVAARLDYTIVGGFARGVVYHDRAQWGNPGNKLAGTYERELVPLWQELDRQPPDLIFNVGAADGYYAVGSLFRWPSARTEAWEMDEESRRQMVALAGLNGVTERLTIHGVCTPPELENRISISPPDLIIMDVEGSEGDLCTPRAIREAAGAIWMIETHLETLVSDLAARFEATHEIEVIENEPRKAAECRIAAARPLLAYDRWRLVQEGRPYPTPWLIARPRQRAAPGPQGLRDDIEA